MNYLETLKQIKEEVLDEYIKEIKNNYSYRVCQNIQQSNCCISLTEVNPINIFEKRRSGFKFFWNLDKSVYLEAPIKILFTGERMKRNDVLKFRYKLISLDDINILFQRTLDVFDENGLKVNRNDIKVALWDSHIIVEIPNEYRLNKKLTIMTRPYVLDMCINDSSKYQFKIAKNTLLSKNIDKGQFILYIDGTQSNRFTILEDSDNFIININDKINNTAEINFIKYIKYQKTSIKNGHIFLDINTKLPISKQSMISFYNGKLIDLKLNPVTSNIFTSDIMLETVDFDIFYGYSETDHNSYFDNYLWYSMYDKNLPNIINKKNLLPEFINKFSLYTEDISLNDFIKNKKYDNIYEYYTEKVNNSMQYNEEFISILINILYKTIDKYDKNDYKTYDFDLNKYNIEANIRTDNTKEQSYKYKQTTFISPTVVFPMRIKPNQHLNVYLDGVLNYKFEHRDVIDDIVYIYLLESDIRRTKYLTFEYITSSYNFNKYREIKVLSNGGDLLTVNDVKKLNLITRDEDIFYLNGFINNKLIDINNVKYDSNNDKLFITFYKNIPENTIIKIVNNNFYKKYEFTTKRSGTNLEYELPELCNLSSNDHIRIFKSGRELPRSTYTIINENNVNKIKIDCKYTLFEKIIIEHFPLLIQEKYAINNVVDGKISIYYNQPTELYFNSSSDYYSLNGIKLSDYNCKYWCSKGVTLHDLHSTRFFRAYHIYNPYYDILMDIFINGYNDNEKLFDKFIVGIMKGDLTDEEPECNLENKDTVNMMYLNLYKEFLRHNIIDVNQKIPEYIALKYKTLINNDAMIIVNTNDFNMMEWMPLDGNYTQQSNTVKIEDLYYELMSNVTDFETTDITKLPADIYNKYKILFDNNILVIDTNKQIDK